MRYLLWLLRATLFLLLLGLVVKNDQPVVLHFYFGQQWSGSLVVALLVCFTLGVAVGLLAMLAQWLHQRRELQQLRHERQVQRKLAEIGGERQVTHSS